MLYGTGSTHGKEMKRIHIVGCGPRTGTTLMAEAMIACFEIDHHTKHEDRIFVPPPADGNIFLTKDPKDILVIGPLLWVNPDLYVVYMLRDPRDMITSRHWRDPKRYWASLRYWKAYSPWGRKLQKNRRFITIRYEDLVCNPDEVQGKLMERMPFLKKRAPFSRYHEIAQPSEDSLEALRGVRPISPVEIGKWRHHLPRVAGQLQLHGSISRDLIEHRYEKDDSWLSELEGVEPDIDESHWPEYFSRRDLRKRERGKYMEVVKTIMRRVGFNPSRNR
ncbi:MAG: sulfotransferase [Thermodesulfobacteriota bacterium]|nr:sulfotransferase [Thermodesulfobacteriota bacterium]